MFKVQSFTDCVCWCHLNQQYTISPLLISLWHIKCFILTCFHLTNVFGTKNSALPSKNKDADKYLPLWTSLFSSVTLFLEGSMLNFLPLRKNHQMKAGQNNKYNITKTSGLTQVCTNLITWKFISREIVGGEAIVTRDLDQFWSIHQQCSPARLHSWAKKQNPAKN